MVNITKSIRQPQALFLLGILLTLGFLQTNQHEPQAEAFVPNLKPVEVVESKIEVPQLTVVESAPIFTEPIFVQTSPVTPAVPASILGLKIDAINLNIPLGKTTLGRNQELLVPENPNKAAWYKNGPKPGEAGSALITGHLDSPAGPGVFINLRNLKAGDRIEVKRDDGKIAIYEVEKSESYAQDQTFPWNLVYATSGVSTLRIITCDGTYNPKTGRYSRNLVVYASLVSLN